MARDITAAQFIRFGQWSRLLALAHREHDHTPKKALFASFLGPTKNEVAPLGRNCVDDLNPAKGGFLISYLLHPVFSLFTPFSLT